MLLGLRVGRGIIRILSQVLTCIGLFTLFVPGYAQSTLVLVNGDVSNDNRIDDSDLLQVLLDFGSSNPSDPDSDLNGDGVVNESDLLIVNFSFGQAGENELTGNTPPQERPYQLGAKVLLVEWEGAPQQPVHVYFGVAFGKQDLEGGIFYMPANWGRLITEEGPDRGQEVSMPGYNRWIPYLKALPGRKGPPRIGDQYKFVGDPNKLGNHIRYDNNLGAHFGLIVEIQLLPEGKGKIATARIKAWEGSEDGLGDPLFDKPLVAAAKDPERSIPTQGVRVRRIASIAQVEVHVRPAGYKRTGSYLGTRQRPVGVGVVPIITGNDLDEVQLYRHNIGWQVWTADVTEQVINCPASIVNANFSHNERWFRERLWIDLR